MDIPDELEGFARQVLEMADAVERDEQAIKQELLKAADAGDVERVREILRRWLSMPVSQVLESENGLMSAAKTCRRR